MYKTIIPLIFITILITACGAKSQIQDMPEVHLSRNFGYSSLGRSEIQGNFTIAFNGPKAVTRVVFLIDGKPMAPDDTEFPFTLKFDTGTYGLGEHTLSAIGYSEDGLEYRGNDIQVKFVTAGQGLQVGLKIALPILGLLVLVTIVGIGFPFFLTRGRKQDLAPGTPRNYGIRGGAICPRCKRPYASHLFSLNLFFHRLDRCPYCGKWAIVRIRTLKELRAAEDAELERASHSGQLPPVSQEDELRKKLNDSRYQDL